MQCELIIPGVDKLLRLQTHTVADKVSEQIQNHHIWEPYETSLVLAHLKPGGVFLDIGANIGYYTVLASTAVGKTGLVIAYEPDAENFRLLRNNIALNRLINVKAFKTALADHNGSGTLYLSSDNLGDHTLFETQEQRRMVEIQIVHGDEHIAGLTSRVDFIKIDTQGSEVHILKGLERTIHANMPNLSMVIELWPYALRRAGTSAMELLDIIAGYELELFIIDHLAHLLMPATPADLEAWVRSTDADPSNQGFMNLFLTADNHS